MDHSLEGYLQRQTTDTLYFLLRTQELSEEVRQAIQALLAQRERADFQEKNR